MSQQIGIELEDSKYYIVWVAPNPDFPAERLKQVMPFDSFMVANGVASQML